MDEPLCPGCRERDARISALEEQVAELAAKVRDLTQPPAARPREPLPKGPPKRPTGKKPGGQPGHPPHLKTLVPLGRVKEIVAFVPDTCQHCQASLPLTPSPEDPSPVRHQVAELPKVIAEITEYQGQARTCPCCGKVTRASIPEDIRAHSVGPGLTAVLSYLSGAQGISKRGVEEIAEAIFDAPVSLGSVCNLEQEVSAALQPAYEEAQAAVRQAPVKNVDETGWKEAGRKRWLWVAASVHVVVFMIHRLRSIVALRKLLGATWAGILGSDRWRAYDHVPILQRQLCWAHLKRNWEKMQERGGKAKVIADALLSVHQRVFEIWHLYRGGGCSHTAMDAKMAPMMLELLEVLRSGMRCREEKTQRHCARLEAVFPGLWTFVVQEGVEPTNNHAERVQRRAVLWRRRSFGCHSAAGCRFVERILTVVQSLRLQQRSVVQFLHETLAAHRSHQKGPKLVMDG